MIYVYRRAASEGADTLVEDICLKGVRARRTRGQLLERLQNGDRVVCWGESLANPVPAGVKVLNNVPVISKFREAQTLAAAGVPTVQVSQTRPQVRAAARPAYVPTPFNLQGARLNNSASARAIARLLQEYAAAEEARVAEHARRPVAPAEEWLPRRNNHQGGSDLLRAPQQVDFYSKKEDIVEEYRIHIFQGRSIRAGIKKQRPNRPNGQASHPWIRSFEAGWVITYDGFQSTEEQRKIAKKALEALKLDFGAIDMGKTRDGRLIVLEVNRAPGVEGGTAESYATKIIAWANGEDAQPRAARR